MKITEFKIRSNFDNLAIKAELEYQKASRLLTIEEEAIEKGTKEVGKDYHEAFMSYMEKDNIHADYFRDYIKFHYILVLWKALGDGLDTSNSNVLMARAKQLKETLEMYFASYDEIYTELKENEEAMRNILKEVKGLFLLRNPFVSIEYASGLMRHNAIHCHLHEKITSLRDDVIIPFFDKCSDYIELSAEQIKKKIKEESSKADPNGGEPNNE